MKFQLSASCCLRLHHLMRLLPACFFFLATQSALAQAPVISWLKCLGGPDGEYAHDIRSTTDGGYIVAGYTENKGGDILEYHGNPSINDLWVVKLNSAGAIQWQRSLGNIYMQTGADVRQTPDGGYVIAGSSVHAACDGVTNYSLDFWLVKLNANGEIQWEKTYGGSRHEYLYGLDLTQDGGYILTGHSESTDGDVTGNHGDRDFWVVKVNSSGILQWQKSLGGSGVDAAYSIAATADGGYIAAGYTASTDGDVTGMHGKEDFWVVKLSASGALQWQKSLGGTESDEAWSVQSATDGGCIVAGYTNSINGTVSGKHMASDFWVVKLNDSGALQWQKCYGGNANDIAYAIQKAPDGGYVVAGSAESADGDVTCNAGYVDMWVIKIGSTGQLQWQKNVGGTGFDEAYSVQPLSDGSVAVAGATCSPNMTGYHVHNTYEGTCADFCIVKLSTPVSAAPAPSVTITPDKVCSGVPVTLTATALNVGPQPSFQWQRNGVAAGSDSPTYTASDFANDEVITCTAFSGGSCDNTNASASARITIKRNTITLNPSINISASQNAVCTCTSVTFTATVNNGGSAPVYRWKINDVYTDGSSATYTAPAIKAGDVVTCVYSDTSGCVPGGALISDPVVITAASGQAPTISIKAGEGVICNGSTVTFTATALNAGAAPVFQWQVNNMNTGGNSNTFTSNSLANGDVVTCLLKTDPLFTCTAGGTVTSDPVTIHFSEKVFPTVTVTASSTTVCVGASVTYTSMPANAGEHPSYAWRLNGAPVGTNSNVFTSTAAEGDSVYCIVTTDPLFTCAAATRAVSKTADILVQRPLTPTITASIDKNAFCSGTAITLTAVAQGAGTEPSYQWMLNGQPAGTRTVYKSAVLNDGDALYCQVTPKQGACPAQPATSNTIQVVVYAAPIIRITPADTTIAMGGTIQFTTTVTGAIAQYTWSPLSQLQPPNSLNPSTTVLTDGVDYLVTVTNDKGCITTSKAVVHVIKKLYMPNAFTPNGDGRNDVFRIPPGVSLTLKSFAVFDQWGNAVFTTRNIVTGWDGTLKGLPLGTGNYVYLIEGTDEKGAVFLKGNVMLLR